MSGAPDQAIALLIDADNLTPDAVQEAFAQIKGLAGHGQAHLSLRYAYGGFEKLAGLKEVLRRHAVRAIVNQGKGTTDVALVIDVMDMLHRGQLPGTVVIGSSDADFAPLAVRLRETGRRVWCLTERDKAAAESLARAYDKVLYVDAPTPVAKLEPEPKPLPLPTPTPRPAVASKAVPKRVPLSPPAVSAVAAPDEREAVRRIVEAVGPWLPNTVKQLNQLGTPLRELGITKGSKPLHELFRKYPAYFKVLPLTGQAKQVRLEKAP